MASAMTTVSQLDWADCPAVEQDPQRVSGAWVFRGTRIPVAALFQNLEDGVSHTEFAEIFPGVTIEQSRLVLELSTPNPPTVRLWREGSRLADGC